MEELKILVEMVATLPSMALWVIAFFFVYKISIIGSIYGIIRFVTGKVHDVIVVKKTQVVEQKEIRPMLDGMCILDGTVDMLIAQLHRIKPMSYRDYKSHSEATFIHKSAVQWLREAIDEKLEKESK